MPTTIPLLAAACSASDGPHLIRVTPASAPHGASIVVTGERLCGPRSDCATAAGQVQLGLDEPVQAMIQAYDDTRVELLVPDIAPVGATELVVTVDDRSSNALDFEVVP